MYKTNKIKREWNRQIIDNEAWKSLFDITDTLKKNQNKIINDFNFLDGLYKLFLSKLKNLKIPHHKTKNILFGTINYIKKTKNVDFAYDQLYCSINKRLKKKINLK